ncbi:MAG: desulfoferrodoxin family protein, partial [Dehalococcoidales bacterium]|nr:desulfoferrodoxin family protein [Dehalococcoidales bacterium]
TERGIKVKVGGVPHPMEEKHYIEWIQVITDSESCRKLLKPGDKPEADFEIKSQTLVAREHCSVHGLWKSG